MFTGLDSMLAINLPFVENVSVPPEITEATLSYVAKVMVSLATLVFNIIFISHLKPRHLRDSDLRRQK